LRLTAILVCHSDEPGIIDVTSYEDALKALEDGRMEKILEVYKKYHEGTKANLLRKRKTNLILQVFGWEGWGCG
jgi:hypothetical protein